MSRGDDSGPAYGGHYTRGQKSEVRDLPPQGVGGFDQCWYPIGRSEDVEAGEVMGTSYFDGRIVVFRGMSGEASVLSAYCPHLGTDLTSSTLSRSTISNCLPKPGS